jgi:hypothetical protein
MSVVSCPLCGWRVNAATAHCPECGADIHLGHDEALAELAARRGPQSGPIAVRAAPPRLLTRRRLVLVVALVVIVVAVLAAPLLAGYFGPQAATYVTDWRPWRTHVKVQLTSLDSTGWPQQASLGVSYHDPWPGTGLTPGDQFFFVYAHRDSPWLPWTVTSQGTGP